MKFFSVNRIKQSCLHLEKFHSSWVIPPFVFACNGVNRAEFVNLTKALGTDSFLDRYFNGTLIGLPAPGVANTLRPRFDDLMATLKKSGHENDYVLHQNTKLWANAYSSRGYREMVNRGELETNAPSTFRLTDKFQPQFEKNINSSFRFEEFLVWLFAFKGIPDETSSWDELFSYFLTEEIKLPSGFAPEFQGRFNINSAQQVAWPDDFTNERPSNETFQRELLPSRFSEAVKGVSLLNDDDPIWTEIERAVKERNVLNFLFFGPPGTGKTWYANEIGWKLAGGNPDQIVYLQFHPSFSYDDFVEGYSPKIDGANGAVRYEVQQKHFLKLCHMAQSNPDKTYVIVIDEISRGDPSRIFGELLTYIEPYYREKPFSLSYSGSTAMVPKNLIILGTTNPYDRSVSELDDAFLRRFYMMEFPGSASILEQHMSNNDVDKAFQKKILHLFQTLNTHLPHGVGHAHFFDVTDDEGMMLLWNSKLRFMFKRALQYEEERFAEIDSTFRQLFLNESSDSKDEAA